jgi:hypothetical protein
VNNPNRFEEMKVWLRRPGRASTFTPIDGTVQAWMTSVEVINMRVEHKTGMYKIDEVFSSRADFDSSMNDSFSFVEIAGYS